MSFGKTLLIRFVAMIATLTVMSVLIFALAQLMPGDVAYTILGQSATEDGLAAIRDRLGLDDPFFVRYGRWFSDIVRGDLGESHYMRGVAINSVLWPKVGNSLVLALTALLMYVPVSIFFGVLAGVKAGKLTDQIVSFFGLATMALPEFVSGVLFITLFSVKLKIFPISSVIPIGESLWSNLNILILPAMSITIVMFGYVSRMQRSSMIQVMSSDYIRAAYMKGLPKTYVIFRHALKNALLPTITIIGMNMGWLIGGLVVVENLFSFPGLGSLTMNAIKTRDIPLIEACVLFITLIFMLSTIITDFLYGLLNPRIRFIAKVEE